jgi:sortase A
MNSKLVQVDTNRRRVERAFFAAGLVLLGIWGVARLHGSAASRMAVNRFQHQLASDAGQRITVRVDPFLDSEVDFRLWSRSRIAAYNVSLEQEKDIPLGILRIPKMDLQVPIFDGTDELTLNRGVGRIHGTAHLGQPGNLGIAGHRDGFFRGLKDIGIGDVVELQSRGRTLQFIVHQIQIVRPENTSVLAATPTPTLTLVTCYPFYYVGSAPERFIVTAAIKDSGQRE